MNSWRSQITALCLLASLASAQDRAQEFGDTKDPRGEPELVVCSQNLEMLGKLIDLRSKNTSITKEKVEAKEKALIQRFVKARCDVIAVQEVVARNEISGAEVLDELSEKLRFATGRVFESRAGTSNDKLLRNGYLVAKDRASIQNVVSYSKAELPALLERQEPLYFSRGPLEIQLHVNGRGDALKRTVSLINFHFKSRAGAGDASGLEWETLRMQMAEALRRIIEDRHRQSFERRQTLLVVLGDRNSNFDTASAKILDGTLNLSDFQGEGKCRLSKRGVPLCQASIQRPPRFFSVLTGDPQSSLLPGTYHFGKTFYWIDDILLPAETLPFAWNSFLKEGDFRSGVIYEPEDASDHALVYVKLNW